jgi:two-component system sensor histidine kinase PilS (NtrC family)
MDTPQPDRRRADRRRGGRREADLLHATTLIADSAFGPDDGDSRFSWRDGSHAAAAIHDGAIVRVYRTYAAARAALGVALVGAQALASVLGTQRSEWPALIAVAYAVQAITLWLLPRFGGLGRAHGAARRRQWLATIGVDLLAFSLLHLLEAGASFNYGALLVLPVLMAGVLTSRLLALGTAAGSALLLLAMAWRSMWLQDAGPALMLQSGLAGLGLFAITLLAGELAARLVREELAARGSRELARQQAQLNRLVIEEMADGVLVIDGRLRVRAANPAARALLVDQGLGPAAPFTLQQDPAWAELQFAVQQALEQGSWPEAGRDVLLRFGQGHTRTLRMRVRFMRGSRGRDNRRDATPDAGDDDPGHEPRAVLLLEDLRTLQARIRQEKLAAMGRVSVGIAHEIRNPLAAIAQANALLLEDPLPPAQQQLAAIVADNVERLKRVVDDVMELAPGGEPAAGAIDATATIAAVAADWMRTAQLAPAGGGSNGSAAVPGAEGRLRTELPQQPLVVRFDAEHLRRVLVNLLDNAHRHARPGAGAVFLRLAVRDDAWALLSVLSDSPPIAPEVERHLFEPFFSTRSRGSGLGLYICRELCERHGASIEYRPRPAAERLRNEFVVHLRRVARAADADVAPAVDAESANGPAVARTPDALR